MDLSCSRLGPDPGPEEVEPKFVKGHKRYGRRSRPESLDLDLDLSRISGASRLEGLDLDLSRISGTSLLEGMDFENDNPNDEENREKAMERTVPQCDPGGAVCSVCVLLRRMEPDVQGRVHLRDIHRVLSVPMSPSSSTPQRPPLSLESHLCDGGEGGVQCLLLPMSPVGAEGLSFCPPPFAPRVLTVGQRLLSVLDDGSGKTSAEEVLCLWREEGLRDSEEVLQMLDFSLDSPVCLSDLSVALENELLVSGNSLHQAAVICYRMEVQHLQTILEQVSRERDKAKCDLEQSDLRNQKLIRESEDRQTSVESSAERRVREVEASCRGRLSAHRAQTEHELELLLQQLERERSLHQEAQQELRTRESTQQEALLILTQENLGLEQELVSVKLSMREAQNRVDTLHQDLERLLLDKFSLDLGGGALSLEERFTEILREYDLQFRELRDRNDELNSELELLQSQRAEPRDHRPDKHLRPDLPQGQTSDYDEAEASPRIRRKLLPVDGTVLASLDSGVDSVSIQTELALEKLREEHQEEIHQLQVKLETQVNFYERRLEQMRSSVELERKDISQAFKMEICELEEQKFDLESQLKQLKENMERNLQKQNEQRSREQEKRLQRERAEMEQNFAREISNLVQRLSAEKDQLEAELRLRMDQEVLLVRSNSGQTASWEKHLTSQEETLRLLQEALLQSQSSSDQLVQSQSSSDQLLQSQSCFEQSHQEALRRGREEERLEEEVQLWRSRCSQLEERQEEEVQLWRSRCSQLEECLEEEVQHWRSFCSQLEERLEKACSQLKECVSFLEAHGLLNRRLMKAKVWVEGELRRVEEALRYAVGRREVKTLRRDKDRLIQDLKEQAMAVDTIRLQLEERERRSKDEEQRQEGERRRREEEQSERRKSREEERRVWELDAQEEVVGRLSVERSTYMRLRDQLSVQIIDMEEENRRLGEENAGLRGENMKGEKELQSLRQVSEERLDYLEALVRHLEQKRRSEEERDSCRTQMEEVRSENGALQERLTLLQHEMAALEEEVASKQRKLEEAWREREQELHQQEALLRENTDLRGQVLDLSQRNLDLSDSNAELSSKIRSDQESLVLTQDRLKTRTQEQEETSIMVQRLKEDLVQMDRDKQQWLSSLNMEKHNLQTELDSARTKVARVPELESELQRLGLKLQWSQDDNERLRRDVLTRQRQVEDLGKSLKSFEMEAESVRAQLQLTNQEALSHKQGALEAQKRLEEAQSQVQQLESSLRAVMTEKDEVTSSLEAELQQQRVKNLDLDSKAREVQVGIERVQSLRTKVDQLETAKNQAQDQALRADTTLSLVQAQHLRQVRQLQETRNKTGTEDRSREDRSREDLDLALNQLRDERQKSERLEQELKERDTLGLDNKVFSVLKERADNQETQLKATRLLLQEKVSELQDQVSVSGQVQQLVQALYLENSELQGALQVTEQRHREAQKKSQILESKVQALNQVLRQLVPHALA